jgi:hypothetical protein
VPSTPSMCRIRVHWLCAVHGRNTRMHMQRARGGGTGGWGAQTTKDGTKP